MQKKLALIEPHHHSEVLRTFARLFLHLGWKIQIFTNPQVHQDLYELSICPAIEWTIQKGKSKEQFIEQQKQKIDHCDLALFVTIASDYTFFSNLQLKTKTILIIHNGNTFFDAWANISLSTSFPQLLKDGLKFALFYGRRENQQRQQMLANFDYLSMATPAMIDYFKKQNKLPSEYHFTPALPLVFFEGIPEEAGQGNSEIKIAIPGVLRGEGRDYKKVVLAFRQIVPELRQSVELIFLGSAQSKYAREIIKDFQQIENAFFKIRYSSGFISQKEFDSQLRQVDFLILPLKKSYRLGIIREIYGHTNISGGINDMIRFGIPTLITSFYPLEASLRKMTSVYDSTSQLSDLLKDWIGNMSFKNIRNKAPQYLESYQKEDLAEALQKQLNEIL